MGYNVKFQVTDKERKALLSLLSAANKYREEGEPVMTLDSFAKDAMITAANRLYALMTKPIQSTEGSEEHGEQSTQSEQQQSTPDSSGSVPDSGLAEVSDNAQGNG